ncbi:STAS domain-containing protein [Nocardioides perillae]|uniref:Anti-anti-sigma factor n=1 Tax=Nocardioides perillae TaxID=1119534 RepID=A0A7Y9ULU5_9ACTN|nr:STAS domain-containing protein [Nocardioides perillae]NYG55452.1 anti-anti-sigma factor [Nocardioides perillae]
MTTSVHTLSDVGATGDADGATIRLVGSFDARCTAEVRDALHALLAEHRTVVVDLAEVHGVDLTALRVLAAASHQAQREGHHVVLRGCGPAVRRLLHLSHLIRAVEVERVAVPA